MSFTDEMCKSLATQDPRLVDSCPFSIRMACFYQPANNTMRFLFFTHKDVPSHILFLTQEEILHLFFFIKDSYNPTTKLWRSREYTHLLESGDKLLFDCFPTKNTILITRCHQQNTTYRSITLQQANAIRSAIASVYSPPSANITPPIPKLTAQEAALLDECVCLIEKMREAKLLPSSPAMAAMSPKQLHTIVSKLLF